jgi:diguanylate cyclase (GGDEF)-like protein
MIPFNIYVLDIETHEVIFINKHFINNRGDIIGQKCYKAIYGEDEPCYFCKIHQLVSEKNMPLDNSIVFEVFNPLDDNWYQCNEKALSWPDGRIVKYSIAVNISELKKTQNRLAEAHAQLSIKNKELQKISSTDKLTQLCNRQKLDEIIHKEIEKSKTFDKTFSLVLFDIDYFKCVNDEYGHLVGDTILTELSKVLISNVKSIDTLGRWGGDEFMIILPETDLNNAIVLCEKLRSVVENYEFSHDIHCTLSFGVANMEDCDSKDSLIKRADELLYKAKEKGRNRIEGKF